jgi:hypothetical protein
MGPRPVRNKVNRWGLDKMLVAKQTPSLVPPSGALACISKDCQNILALIVERRALV